MQKITTLFILLLFLGVNSFSQKKSGTIFSEHESIEKTKELWKAFAIGDVEKYRSFFADSAYLINNGKPAPKTAHAQIGKSVATWAGNYEHFQVENQPPAYPDAMEYKEGGTWVQDWLLLTGVHKNTGVILNLPLHNLYQFNEEGKITAMISYFENDVFEEIANSQTTRENGKLFINHPYIVTVRKAMNAFVEKDMEKWLSFYSPKALFSNLSMQPDESHSLEEYKEAMSKMFFREDLKFKVEQVGYPDCIYYEKSDNYIVYSWWKMVVKKEGKMYEFPFMISHDFDKEGMIVFENIYMSSNHLENL
ncbi:MAG: nuclear transport factor 2 family protein [Bacteroidales bacterium]